MLNTLDVTIREEKINEEIAKVDVRIQIRNNFSRPKEFYVIFRYVIFHEKLLF